MPVRGTDLKSTAFYSCIEHRGGNDCIIKYKTYPLPNSLFCSICPGCLFLLIYLSRYNPETIIIRNKFYRSKILDGYHRTACKAILLSACDKIPTVFPMQHRSLFA